MKNEYPLSIRAVRAGPSTPSLDSVRQKIFRVLHHYEELEAELKRYFQTNPVAMVPASGNSLDDCTFTFQATEPIPARFGLVVGDCLQNLRSSLDYLVWELVLAAGNEPNSKNAFPICLTPGAFEDALKHERLKGVDPEAIAVVKRLQPFNSLGDHKKDYLWVLDKLTNINKHRRVLPTILGAFARDGAFFSEVERTNGGSDVAPDLDEKPLFQPVKCFGDTKVNARLGAFLAFSEEEDVEVEGENVTSSLERWVEYVLDKVFPDFERFFHRH